MRFAGLKVLVGLLIMCPTSCATMSTTGTSKARPACSVFEPITYSLQNDTRETVKQIIKHNAAWESYCGASDEQ